MTAAPWFLLAVIALVSVLFMLGLLVVAAYQRPNFESCTRVDASLWVCD